MAGLKFSTLFKGGGGGRGGRLLAGKGQIQTFYRKYFFQSSIMRPKIVHKVNCNLKLSLSYMKLTCFFYFILI